MITATSERCEWKYALLALLENCGQESKTKSLEMTSELGIPVSVTSNREAGKLALTLSRPGVLGSGKAGGGGICPPPCNFPV